MTAVTVSICPLSLLGPAVSFVVHCKDQSQVDDYWAKLTDGGEEVACGWLTDRFGVSWQVVPDGFVDLLTSDDREASQRAMRAMMQMKKLDIDALRKAYAGS